MDALPNVAVVAFLGTDEDGTHWRVAVRGTGRGPNAETFASRDEATARAVELAEKMHLDAYVIDRTRMRNFRDFQREG